MSVHDNSSRTNNPTAIFNNVTDGRKNTSSGHTVVCEHCEFNEHTLICCFKPFRYPAIFGKKKNGQPLKEKNVVNTYVWSTKFCNLNGFVHQISYSYTLQHNGIVKRIHMDLLNVARSLLLLGGFPMNMWSRCTLIDTCLISRLPFSVLKGKSPYELIYNEKPVLDHLRVFGCLCFATILNDSDKMSSRSEKCVMIGYSNVKKGYKLYSLINISSYSIGMFSSMKMCFPLKDLTLLMLMLLLKMFFKT